MPVTALPIPPSRNDPANFSPRADAFLGALPTFALELNNVEANVDASEAAAINAANVANAAANSAVLASNTTAWVSGTTYSAGATVWSPTTFQTFRRRNAGSGTTDPANDSTNWEPLSISSTNGITLNNDVAYSGRTTGGASFALLKVNTANLTQLFGNNGIRLISNGIESVIIDGSGNVGIGTVPVFPYKLDIAGTGFVAARIRGNSTSETQLRFEGNTSARIANLSNTDLIIDTNGAEAIRVRSGNTGFGMVPTGLRRVDIAGNLAVSGNLAGTIADFEWSATDFRIKPFASAGSRLSLHTNSNGGPTLERAVIDSQGNVGIGTASPQSLLHVSSTSPELIISRTDQGLDSKSWKFSISGSTFNFGTTSDNNEGMSVSYRINRTGNSVTSQEFLTNGVVRLSIGGSGTVLYENIEIGYKNVPRVTSTIEQGKCLATSSGLTLVTGPAAGSTYSIYNDSNSAIIVTQGSGLTLRLAGTNSVGNRTISPRGMATVWYNSGTEAIISGAGVS